MALGCSPAPGMKPEAKSPASSLPSPVLGAALLGAVTVIWLAITRNNEVAHLLLAPLVTGSALLVFYPGGKWARSVFDRRSTAVSATGPAFRPHFSGQPGLAPGGFFFANATLLMAVAQPTRFSRLRGEPANPSSRPAAPVKKEPQPLHLAGSLPFEASPLDRTIPPPSGG